MAINNKIVSYMVDGYDVPVPSFIKTPHKIYAIGEPGFAQLWLSRLSLELRNIPYTVLAKVIRQVEQGYGASMQSVVMRIDMVGDLLVPCQLRDMEDNYHALGTEEHLEIFMAENVKLYSNTALALIYAALSQYNPEMEG